MNTIDKIKMFFHNMATLASPTDELRSAFGVRTSKAGVHVNASNAMQITAVFACIRLLSENIASLPFSVYERTTKGKKKAVDRVDYGVFHDVANPECDSFQFWQVFMANLLLYGKGYAEIVRDGGGRVAQIWNVTTPYVKDSRNKETNELEYIIDAPNKERFILRKNQIFRVDWFSLDGLNILKPIQLAQNALGLGIAAEEFAAAYFKNGANVSGIVEYPDEMDGDATERFRKGIREAYTGLSNAARLMFLEQGSKFTKISNSPEESQMIDTRKFQVREVARFYNVPPHMIGDLEQATFSNIEQMSLNFVIYTLRPYLVRIEKAYIAQILAPAERISFYGKFNVEALLRGDYASRMAGYAVARQNGWMSTNDIRELDEMDKIPAEQGGDEYLANGNLRSLKNLMNASASTGGTGGGNNENNN